MRIRFVRSEAHLENHPDNPAPESAVIECGEYALLTYSWLRIDLEYAADNLRNEAGEYDDHIATHLPDGGWMITTDALPGIDHGWRFSDITLAADEDTYARFTDNDLVGRMIDALRDRESLTDDQLRALATNLDESMFWDRVIGPALDDLENHA